MSEKKNFRTEKNVTEAFISSVNQPQGDYTPPEGYVLVPEPKTARLQLLVPPRLKEYLVKVAEEEGISLNSLANNILQDYVKGDKE